MKLRDPGKEPPIFDPNLTKVKWKSYEIKLITPMLGGGVNAGKPDTDMPVRASAIKGQLRYWWRFLAMNGNSPSTKQELFQTERSIWGGMAEDEEDHSSKVRLRVDNIKGQHPPKKYTEDEVGYALFPARSQKDPPEEAKTLIREGMTFRLYISAAETIMEKHVTSALSWWITFGGLGSRTRRGVGALYCAEIPQVNEIEAKRVGCRLVKKTSRYDNATEAWREAVKQLYQFRQGNDVGRRAGYKRSYWPEADSIREITGKSQRGHEPEEDARISFPRAAFGLPIIFKFKNEDRGEPQLSTLTPNNSERLASPLILTPYPVQRYNNQPPQYVPAALLLPVTHHNDLVIQLSDAKNRDLTASFSKEKKDELRKKGWDNWTTDWWQKSKSNDVRPIKRHKGQDALTAFMNYFSRGGEDYE